MEQRNSNIHISYFFCLFAFISLSFFFTSLSFPAILLKYLVCKSLSLLAVRSEPDVSFMYYISRMILVLCKYTFNCFPSTVLPRNGSYISNS
jgi:hypothetical protein